MQLTVNGSDRQIPDAWRDETLLSTLREHLNLVGAGIYLVRNRYPVPEPVPALTVVNKVVAAPTVLGAAVEDRAHVFDIHATILRAVGLDDRKLEYMHAGRPERPTINQGEVVEQFFTG